jgi:hypothetical protein
MKTLTLAFSTALCIATLPAFANGATLPDGSFMLAQDLTIGANGIGLDERARERDRNHDRVRARLGDRDRDGDRGCRTVTVQERGETRTTRRCD